MNCRKFLQAAEDITGIKSGADIVGLIAATAIGMVISTNGIGVIVGPAAAKVMGVAFGIMAQKFISQSVGQMFARTAEELTEKAVTNTAIFISNMFVNVLENSASNILQRLNRHNILSMWQKARSTLCNAISFRKNAQKAKSEIFGGPSSLSFRKPAGLLKSQPSS